MVCGFVFICSPYLIQIVFNFPSSIKLCRYMLGYICFSRLLCNHFLLLCLQEASLFLSQIRIVPPLGLFVLFIRPKFRCEFWLLRTRRRLFPFETITFVSLGSLIFVKIFFELEIWNKLPLLIIHFRLSGRFTKSAMFYVSSFSCFPFVWGPEACDPALFLKWFLPFSKHNGME